MSATGRGARRRAQDHYETPAWCVEAIRPHVHMGYGWVIDAGCGASAIIGTTINPTHELVGVELVRERAEKAQGVCDHVVVGDFLDDIDWPLALPAAGVAMNPPYRYAQAFVDRALQLTDGPVVALLRLAFLESQGRRAWWQQHPADVYVLSRRPSFTGGTTDSAAYAWFAWGPGPRGRVAVL